METPRYIDTHECPGCHLHRDDIAVAGDFCPKCKNGGREPERDYIPAARIIGQTRRATLITFAPRLAVR